MLIRSSVIAILGPLCAAPLFAQDIPKRPEDLAFPDLAFEPPTAASFRHELKSGVPVYLAPSSEFPLVTINFSFRGGGFLEDKTGVAGMAGAMIRRGGTTKRSAAQLDEELDFLAASVSTSASGARLNCLTSNLEESFELFMEMVLSPGFEKERLDLYREQNLERMKQRNDNAGSILAREWDFLLYGEEHFLGRVSTAASLKSITADDLRAYHRNVFQPRNVIIWATGDFKTGAMLARLEAVCATWEFGERMPTPPPPTKTLEPGVYHVEKDIPQGRVAIGMRSVQRDEPRLLPAAFDERHSRRRRLHQPHHESRAQLPRAWPTRRDRRSRRRRTSPASSGRPSSRRTAPSRWQSR